jgi:CheY-like chemotaxis protein
VSEAILAVDDNAANLRLIVYLLRAAGYDVHTATTAEEALEVLDRVRPRAILLDVELPGMDGLTVARRLRADPQWQALTIVAVTAQAMRGDREAALAAGCDAYLSKPIDTRTFAQTIAELLGRGVR